MPTFRSQSDAGTLLGFAADTRSGTTTYERRWRKYHVVNYLSMANPLLWLEALAGLKALYDLVQGGVDYATAFQRHRQESDTIAESRRASVTFSTYSDREMEELIKKIEGCRDRFITQGSGADRARCLCSIFREISDGNGGSLPEIDDWRRMYDQLNCGLSLL
jgi:hypothetical protein